MSLWGDSPKYTFGALRNAQLVPVFFPDWRLRVYVEKPLSSGKTQHHPVPQRILDKLDQLGAEMFYVNALQVGRFTCVLSQSLCANIRLF